MRESNVERRVNIRQEWNNIQTKCYKVAAADAEITDDTNMRQAKAVQEELRHWRQTTRKTVVGRNEGLMNAGIGNEARVPKVFVECYGDCAFFCGFLQAKRMDNRS